MQFRIRQVFTALTACRDGRAWDDVLRPSLDRLTGFAAEFAEFRTLAASSPGPGARSGLWTFYALSRVADMLLPPRQSPAKMDDWTTHGVVPDDLLRFFGPLGMIAVPDREFSPFFHEVVSVTEDARLGSSVAIEEVLWPGLMFGDMMFVRAGVRVRCSRAVMDAGVAGRTTLYLAYARRSRPVADLSHGWGHNSQWGIKFRRDYARGRLLHYNVDGTITLSEKGFEASAAAFASEPHWSQSGDAEDLTPAECIELLTHRCFVRTTKTDRDLWPCDDRCAEACPPDAPQSLMPSRNPEG